MFNCGKKFEELVERDLKKVEGLTIDRLPDQMSGMYGSSNVCDFIAYRYPHIYYIECKATKNNAFNISELSQYDKLKTKIGIPGVRCGVLVWFYNLNKIRWYPIELIKNLKERKIESNYYSLHNELKNDAVIDINFCISRVYPSMDFQCFCSPD